MKRIISLVLICVLILGCIFVLASCGAPNPDAEQAQAHLEAKGYNVVTFPTAGKAGIERSFTATKRDEATGEIEWVQIFYITELADGVYDYIKGLFDEKKEEEINKDRNIEFGKKEGVIWFGTKKAIIDAQ